MKYDDVVLKRRSIRKFLDDNISDLSILEIIKFAILSPSAHNRQPWKIKIIRSMEKNNIADAILKRGSLSDTSLGMTSRVIKEAPVLLAVFLDNSDLSQRDDDLLSLGSFIEHICLKATDLGIGSLWIANTSKVKDEISEITNVDLECISTVALGMKDQDPKPRPRKSINDIVL